MKRVGQFLLVIVVAASLGKGNSKSANRIALPNPHLLGCSAMSCSHLWFDDAVGSNALYPTQVTIDISTCPRGLTAHYAPSVSLDDIQMELDRHFGKWALPGNSAQPVRLWRVESEQFAIQLATITSNDAQQTSHATQEAPQLTYLPFNGTSCEGH